MYSLFSNKSLCLIVACGLMVMAPKLARWQVPELSGHLRVVLCGLGSEVGGARATEPEPVR